MKSTNGRVAGIDYPHSFFAGSFLTGLEGIIRYRCLCLALVLFAISASAWSALPRPLIFVDRTPTTLTVGQPYTISWSSGSASEVSVYCTNGGPSDALNLNGSMSGIAQASWVAAPPQCTWMASNDDGMTASVSDTMTTVAPPPNTDAATIVGASIPSDMVEGRTYNVSVTVKNTGNTTWTQGGNYWLGSQNPRDNYTWGPARVTVTGSVDPGQQFTFPFPIVAPAGGAYNVQWQMVRQGYDWFGEISSSAVTVIPAKNNAQVISQTIPAKMTAGQTYPISITVKNTGNTTWVKGGAFPSFLSNATSAEAVINGISPVMLENDVPYGGQYTFKFNATPTVSGNFLLQWRMHQHMKEWFGDVTAPVYLVVEQPPPKVAFAQPASDLTVTATGGLTPVTFSGSATPGPGAPITSMQLSEAGIVFATGSTSVSGSKSLAVGTHVIKLVATDSRGLSSAVTRTVIVSAPTAGSSATPIPVAIASPHLQNPNAGTLPGNLSVGDDGAANYKIELAIPPGSGGLQPALSLGYSSNGSNGMVGLGWSLGGLSSIHRCPKTIAEDGFAGRIRFDTADRLCLDGQKLLQSNGTFIQDTTYWSIGAEYRTELENFARITRLANGGFKVESKDGRISYYGIDSNSAIAAQGRSDGQALLWALARVEDRSGNYYTVSYNQDTATGEYTPKQIRYGANSIAGQAADLAIRFEYEVRPDSQVQYMGGSRNDLRSRLTNIRTFIDTDSAGNGGTLVRDNVVNYKISSTTGRSMVDWIEASARNPVSGVIEALPKTTFSWGDGGPPQLVVGESFKLDVLHDGETRKITTFNADIDGSGRTSVIVPWFDLVNPNGSIEYFNGQLIGRDSSGSALYVQLTLPTTSKIYTQVIPGDLNGDGRDDLILVATGSSKQWAYCLAGGRVNNSPTFSPCVDATASLPNKDALISSLAPPALLSVRNDGKAQVLWFTARTTVTTCELGAGGMSCSSMPADIPIPAGIPVFGFTPIELSKQGMTDLYTAWHNPTSYQNTVTVCSYAPTGMRCQNLASGSGVLGSPSVGDLNSDALTDFVYETPALTRCLSTEAGLDCAAPPLPLPNVGRPLLGGIGDPIGDGVARLIFYRGSSYDNCRLSAEGWVCQNVATSGAGQSLGYGYREPIHQGISIDDSGLPAELNCDAIPDVTSTFNWQRSCVIATLKASAVQDRIVGVINGIGLREEVDYARGDDAAVYRRLAIIDGVEKRPVYPQLIGSVGVLVKQLRRDNGQDGWLRTDFRYEGAMRDAQGRGSLGFGLVQSYDQQSGITSISTFHQTFPFAGMAKTVRRVTPQCTLEDSMNTPAQQSFTMPNGGRTYFAYVATTSQTRRDLDCSDLGSSITSNEYTDGWGNRNVQTITTTGGGKTFTSKTTTAFMTANNLNFLSGLPTSVVTTKTDPDTGSLTRTVGYSHNATTGLRETETIEAGNTAYQVVTTYNRTGNNFGLVNKVIQQWVDPACTSVGWPQSGCQANKVRTVSDTTYDTKGRFPLTVKNALNQQSTQTFSPQTGARTLLDDPNGLRTVWTLDGFGRPVTELRPDGNEKRSYMKLCAGDCPPHGKMIGITEQFHGADRIATPQVTYLDSSGRVLRTKNWGSNGAAIVTEQRFDSNGRLYEIDHPRFEAAPAFLARRQLYDHFGRTVSTTQLDEYGIARTETITYKGMTISRQNPRAQTRDEKMDALGRVREVLDSNTNPGPGSTKFDYDPFNNLTKTIDPNGNVMTVVYDRLGRRIDLYDPNLGRRHYDVDPIGQVFAETSPLHLAGVKSWFVYDLLGRMTARYEPDLESHWLFDTAVNGIGQLAEAYTGTPASKDYRRTQTYDPFGRPEVTTQFLTDGSYTSKVFYDLWGRITGQEYQGRNDPAKTFGLRYNNSGYHSRLERGSLVLWQATVQDASGRPTTVVQGNGLTHIRVFNRFTGRLDNAKLITPTQVERLKEAYIYDELGNVRNRSQYWDQGGFDEAFTYDSLNRLETSKVAGTAEMAYTYDKAGNILSKTGLGAYSYPNPQGPGVSRPHAVISIAGIAGAFTYDNNGNLTAGAGRTATWTTFDMPKQITKVSGATTVIGNFVYGPEHQRVRQIRSDGTTVLYAGAQEIESKGTDRTVKTYWPLGLGVEIDRPGVAATELNWTQLDRLGSPVAITDAAGAIREKLEYDVWGKRRSTLDHIATPDPLDGKTDNRGFTGHEMLDQLDLVHMNGRVYDPMIGKFMSADPLIQDPTNGQNHNRYSYVSNNPTNHTDPTGFCTVVTGSHVCKSGDALDSAKVDVGTMSLSDLNAKRTLGQVAASLRALLTTMIKLDNGVALSANSGSYVNAKAAPPTGCDPGMQCVVVSAKNPTTYRNADNWTDNWFTRGNHIYGRVSDPVCRAPSCDFKKAVQALNSRGVHPNQRVPFVPGKKYQADVDIPGPFGEDHIKTTAVYDKDGNQIGVKNETLLDHTLYPGMVERTIIQRGSEFRIRTEGGGYGYLGGPNIWLPDVVWQPVDSAVAKELRK